MKDDDDLFGLLPEELVVSEIMLRLPGISLLRFKSVCKSWWSTINSPRFKFQHLLQQTSHTTTTDDDRDLYLPFQFPEVEKLMNIFFNTFVSNSDTLGALQKARCLAPVDPQFFQWVRITSCCNSLVLFCLFLDDSDWWTLWNTTTGETKRLPLFSPSARLQQQNGNKTIPLLQSVGLGFDTKTMDYEVITIYDFDATIPSTVLFNMYSLKADSWTTIASFSSRVFEIHCRWHGVFSNGMLSWKAMHSENGKLHTRRREHEVWNTIISVDLSSGNIITTLLPSSITHHSTLNNYPLV